MRVLVIGLGFTGQLFGFLARRRGAGRSWPDPTRRPLGWIWHANIGRTKSTTWAGRFPMRRLPRIRPPRPAKHIRLAARSPVPDHSFDLVVVTPGSPAAMLTGVSAVRNGGALLLFAPTAPGEAVPFPVHELFFREVNIVTSYSAGPDDMKAALQHVHAGDVPADVLISHRFRLEHEAEAYKAAQDVHKALKVVVTMD